MSVQGGAPESTQDQRNKALFEHAVLEHLMWMWQKMVQPKEKDLNAKQFYSEPTFRVKLMGKTLYIHHTAQW